MPLDRGPNTARSVLRNTRLQVVCQTGQDRSQEVAGAAHGGRFVVAGTWLAPLFRAGTGDGEGRNAADLARDTAPRGATAPTRAQKRRE